MIIKFNKMYLQYLYMQRGRIKTEYNINDDSPEVDIAKQLSVMFKKDFDLIKSYLPPAAVNILDIGCGLGMVNLYLYNHYGTPNLYLIDKSENIDPNSDVEVVTSGYHQKYVFYNSLEATRNTLIDNGIPESKLTTIDADHIVFDDNVQFDLIISTISCGWHYPIDTYIQLIKETISDNGILILDVRNGTNGANTLRSIFENVEEVYNSNEKTYSGSIIGNRFVCKNIKKY